jgi:hypothetical protein
VLVTQMGMSLPKEYAMCSVATRSVTILNTKSDDVIQTSLTALHRKLELSESAVLVADREPVK